MVMYTKNNLKIRLDPRGVEEVISPFSNKIDLEDALRDVELWANFPNAFSNVAAIITAALSKSIATTLLAFIISYFAANIFQQFNYSKLLKVIFPQLLGSWLISLPVSIAVTVFLYKSGSTGAGIALLLTVLANWIHITDFILVIFMPIRVGLKKIFNTHYGDVELALIKILNHQARLHGLKLNWNLYRRIE